MERHYFSLDIHRQNKLTRIFQLVFGVICAIVAIAWLIINFGSAIMNASMWLTILFLLGFAYFQIASGLGRAEKFIELYQDIIRLKRNSVLPVKVMKAADIGKIEIFPISVLFIMKTGKTLILRFGITYTDAISPVKEAIEEFCHANKISIEFKEEEV